MIKKAFKSVISAAQKHRIIAVIIVIAILGSGYFAYASFSTAESVTRYTLGTVERGTIMTAISGTGQVSASSQVELKAQASGAIISVKVKNGQSVKKNDVLVQLDSRDAQKSVRDAQANLESALLSLEKLKEPATPLELLQAENSLAAAIDAKRRVEDNATKAYEDAFNAVADAFLDFPSIISGLYDIQYSYGIGASERSIGGGQDNNAALMNSLSLEDRDILKPFQSEAIADYQAAKDKYDANFSAYRQTDRTADDEEVAALLQQTLDTARSMAEAAKSESNYIDTWVDIRTNDDAEIFSQVEAYQSELNSHIGQTNSHLSALLSLQSSMKDSAQDIADAETAISEKTSNLAELQAGADAYDLNSQEIAVRQRRNSLADALEKYADYSVRAPFDGVAASVEARVGDEASSGESLVTLITTQRIATITVNEVDVATLKSGQKASLTFDAVSDLEISGEVIDVGIIGAVSQGVVSYEVMIGFDTQDERIKPGMSVSASVVTDIEQDVIVIPNGAVKSQSGQNYALVAAAGTVGSTALSTDIAPEKRIIMIGKADESNTQVVSGLDVGEIVVVKTAAVTKESAASEAPSLLQSLMPQRGGNAGRAASGSSSAGTGAARGTGAGADLPPPMGN